MVRQFLFRSVSIASLAFFRMSFGVIMLWEAMRYLTHDWVREYWIRPEFHFTYEFFGWLKPWPGDGMILHFGALAALASMIAVGLYYRIAIVLFFLGFTYVFLLEQAYYWNHMYLIVLVSFLMIFVPAHRALSLDARRRKNLRSSATPAWSVALLQFQLGIVYVFGAIAKMNHDWLLRAEPLGQWLRDRTNFPLIGAYFSEPWAAYSMAYGGMLLDLGGPVLLMWRKTRPYAFTALLAFHFLNDRLFRIGIFPWLMILATPIFFEADWPHRFVRTFREDWNVKRYRMIIGMIVTGSISLYLRREFEFVPFLIAAASGMLLVWCFVDCRHNPQHATPQPKTDSRKPTAETRTPALILTGLCVWAFIQIALPSRQFFIPGNVSWTEEGHRFSWHMKLRDKEGKATFIAVNPRDTNDRIEIHAEKMLKRWQYLKMVTMPYMIQQFAVHLQGSLARAGKGDYQIRVASFARLNSRPYELMIDSAVDLTTQSFNDFTHNAWITQLRDGEIPDSSRSIPDQGEE